MEQNCSSTVFRDPDGEQCDSLLDWKMKTCFYPLHGTLANDRTLRSSKELNSCQVSGLEAENLQAPFPGILKARAEALCCRAYPTVAKVEDAADSRRQGCSRSRLLQTLDNVGDAVLSAFLEGKQHGVFWILLDFTAGDIQDARQKHRKTLAFLSFHTFWRGVYATVGLTLRRGMSRWPTEITF